MGERGGPRSRNRKVANSDPQSANPQSAQSLATGTRATSFPLSTLAANPGLTLHHAVLCYSRAVSILPIPCHATSNRVKRCRIVPCSAV
eukprot:13831945-Alexandrium_andersonii.AAC.1